MTRKILVTCKVDDELRLDFPSIKAYLDERAGLLVAAAIRDSKPKEG